MHVSRVNEQSLTDRNKHTGTITKCFSCLQFLMMTLPKENFRKFFYIIKINVSLGFLEMTKLCTEMLRKMYSENENFRSQWQIYVVENLFFGGVNEIAKRKKVVAYNLVSNLTMSLLVIYRKKSSEDSCDKSLNQIIGRLLIEEYRLVQDENYLYPLWTIFVLATNYGYFSIANQVEQRIMEIVPDFEGKNIRFLTGFGESIFSQGLLCYLNTSIRMCGGLAFRNGKVYGPMNDGYGPVVNTNLQIHFASMLNSTDWGIDKYVELLKIGRSYPLIKEVILKKIKEKLLLSINLTKKDQFSSYLKKVKLLMREDYLVSNFFYWALDDEDLCDLARYYHFSKKENNIIDILRTCKNTVKNSDSVKMEFFSFLFELCLLEMLRDEKTTEAISLCKGWLIFDRKMIDILYHHAWSDECREFLSNF